MVESHKHTVEYKSIFLKNILDKYCYKSEIHTNLITSLRYTYVCNKTLRDSKRLLNIKFRIVSAGLGDNIL